MYACVSVSVRDPFLLVWGARVVVYGMFKRGKSTLVYVCMFMREVKRGTRANADGAIEREI